MYPDMKTFVEVLRDREKRKTPSVLCRNTLSPCALLGNIYQSKKRLGEKLYNEIFYVLVEIAELLGFLFYKLLAIDGTLFRTNARYKGCTTSVMSVSPLNLEDSLKRPEEKPSL